MTNDKKQRSKKNKKVENISGKMFFLDTGIYPGTILVAYNMKYDDIINELNIEGSDSSYWLLGIEEDQELIDNKTSSALALSRTIVNDKLNETKKLYYIILKKPFEYTDEDYCVLAHEVLHICQFHLPDLLNRNNEFESEAYLHTYLMRNILKKIRDIDSKH